MTAEECRWVEPRRFPGVGIMTAIPNSTPDDMADIRPAGPADADAIAAIYAPFVEHTSVSFETVAPGPDAMRRRIAETTALYPWLVCTRNNSIVGYAYASEHRARAAYRWSVDVAVYIDPAHHRCGAGGGLYTALLAILRAQGFFNAWAGITLPNPASVGLHEAMGFRRLGIYERVGYKLGAWHDVGWWQLALQPHVSPPAEPLAFAALGPRPERDFLRSAPPDPHIP